MKVKHILMVFILGMLLVTTGAFFKIQHWPGANIILMVALILEVIGGLLLIWKLATIKEFKDFLNK